MAESDARWRAIRDALLSADPDDKRARVAALDGLSAPCHPDAPATALAGAPGRPPRPVLLHPRDVPTRGLGSEAGRVALLHAVAHIEFNAINLALDAAARFPGMPDAFYRDWLSVAADEARHFGMLRDRLADHGVAYGDHPAHNGLWEMAEKTTHDPLHRMALVPRVLEARGLDVTPGMIARLEQAGDRRSADVLRVILDEEVRHVAIGTRWFRWLCARHGLVSDATFTALLADYGVALRPPFNDTAREQAGFSRSEMMGAGPGRAPGRQTR
ncbi:ferritin-like domain-containing protein [Algiphilus sp.]|uniref:ferritin-like domain-containing protein n=1 Tax=Algiphilus sp. TaxID=1872431 RepID=UPI0025BA90AA|nr:ferritin-like domain-containing protein [Algiphilus sp.]MCK5770257.1 ferritin-like domain-containing protein [Algiphilus sp.]